MFKLKIINKPENLKIKSAILDMITLWLEELMDCKYFWIINIIFADDDYIKELNGMYRKIDKTTDVLSFHYFDDFSCLKKTDIAWEVLLSKTKIKDQSEEFSKSEEEETIKLIVHSIFHILWYDHETEYDYVIMSKLENSLWDLILEKTWLNIK